MTLTKKSIVALFSIYLLHYQNLYKEPALSKVTFKQGAEKGLYD